jgi:hypothetical protein
VAFSNATPGMLSTLLNANGIAQHLDAIISLHEVRRYKPHPDAYHSLAQHCQTRRDNCWLVSRHSWDVLGAIHAGLHGIWVRPDGTPNEPLLEALKVDLNLHLTKRVRDKHAVDRVDGSYRLLRSVELVERFDFYGYVARPRQYARLTFATLGAAREARWALSEPVGRAASSASEGRKPALCPHVLESVFSDRVQDVRDAVARKKGARRKGLEFVLAEANIELHDQVMCDLDLRPGCWCDPSALEQGEAIIQVDRTYNAPPGLRGADLRAALPPVHVARAAPVRVLAWDLEVWCEPLGDGAMRFYNGDQPGAKLLCVSAVTFDYGVSDSTRSVVFALGNAPSAVTLETATDGKLLEVRWFGADESKLMVAFWHTNPTTEHVQARRDCLGPVSRIVA